MKQSWRNIDRIQGVGTLLYVSHNNAIRIHSLILFFGIWRAWRHRIWRARFEFNKCPWQRRRVHGDRIEVVARSSACSADTRNVHESTCDERARSSSHCGNYYYLAAHHRLSCILGDTRAQCTSAVKVKYKVIYVINFAEHHTTTTVRQLQIHENSNSIHATQWLSRLPRLKRLSVIFFLSSSLMYTHTCRCTASYDTASSSPSVHSTQCQRTVASNDDCNDCSARTYMDRMRAYTAEKFGRPQAGSG